ncbi:hypothetical protein [Mesobacillus jeotgali]|uniref:hypothetical protein n=1 Tax=Mesobacillus jeotgali TaxID=129985 RepID=UPI00178677BE|nr:hypothetical protein [Mesobacillus jeotgali]UYZ23274.1 hypothetical protein FOF60_06940 [Mesobacillus jeotgali]
MSKLDNSSFNTIILDGTSEIDLDYNVNENIDILSMPKGIRDYNQLEIYNAPLTISKQSLKIEPSLKEKVVESIKILAEKEKVFVLCFKEHKPELINDLSKEISNDRVKINHYGNVKGSNEYVDCTVMVIVGIQHKSDPYYISKHIALNGDVLSNETITINGVRRFKDLEIERVKLNDQLVGIIQDILRTKIRNRSNKEVVRIFIPTRDKIFISLLKEYFSGSSLLEWNLIESSKPSWYKQMSDIFSSLLINETITKQALKEKLGLNGPAGNKKLQRVQTTELFQGLLRDNNIKPLSTKMYIKTQ